MKGRWYKLIRGGYGPADPSDIVFETLLVEETSMSGLMMGLAP